VDNEDDASAVFLDPSPHFSDEELVRMVSQIRTVLMISYDDPDSFSHANERAADANKQARHILMDFWHRALHRTDQSPVTIEWLASCFMKVLDHEHPRNPLQSFGLLPRPKGKPRDEMNSFDVAAWVLVAMRRGYTKAEAKDMAAGVFDIDLKQVERHMRNEALKPEHLSADEETWDIHFNIPSRDKPARPLPEPRRS
jgi:hypothetical protein